MADVDLGGIKTHYIVNGEGPALLTLAPRAFDATLESWRKGRWGESKILDKLATDYKVIAYDRRECGRSGGRMEVLTWSCFAHQAKLLLDHLGIERAYILGVCKGVGIATQLASSYPETCAGLILAQPVGGFRWKMRMHDFFHRHIALAKEIGLANLAREARLAKTNFLETPEYGPWARTIANDVSFAQSIAEFDLESYLALVEASCGSLFPSTFVSGPSPEKLQEIRAPCMVWPGDDASHSTSCAHQLRELIPFSRFWNASPDEQTGARMLTEIASFIDDIEGSGIQAAQASPSNRDQNC